MVRVSISIRMMTAEVISWTPPCVVAIQVPDEVTSGWVRVHFCVKWVYSTGTYMYVDLSDLE